MNNAISIILLIGAVIEGLGIVLSLILALTESQPLSYIYLGAAVGCLISAAATLALRKVFNYVAAKEEDTESEENEWLQEIQ